MIPALVGSLLAVYSAGKAVDNWRYWDDYRKNTGYSPRYPFQSKSMDWMRSSGYTGISFNSMKKM